MYAPFLLDRPKSHANRTRREPKFPFILMVQTLTTPLSCIPKPLLSASKMPLPNPDDVDDLLNNSSDEEDNNMAAEVAAASIRHAQQAGVVPPPPPVDGVPPYYLLGQRTQLTQETLIPTQHSNDAARRHMILSQLAMTQGSTGGTEFDELEKTLRQQYPTQSQTETGQNKKKEGKPKAKSSKITLPKGRSSGARGYTEEERMNFLEILERRLPTSGSEWSLVASEHSETYGIMERNVDSIKRQYQGLLRRREPTGDPNCPPDVKKAKAIDRLLKAKQRAGDISEENGGPIAALAGMEIQEDNPGIFEDNGRTDTASIGTNVTGAALVQKRSSPKSRGSSTSLIETMISFQMMQAEKEEKRREEENRKEEQRRNEERQKEDLRRRREEEERREQRRRDERREEMFMSLMTAGLAAFSGGGINPANFIRGTHSREREEPDTSNDTDDDPDSDTPPTKRSKKE